MSGTKGILFRARLCPTPQPLLVSLFLFSRHPTPSPGSQSSRWTECVHTAELPVPLANVLHLRPPILLFLKKCWRALALVLHGNRLLPSPSSQAYNDANFISNRPVNVLWKPISSTEACVLFICSAAAALLGCGYCLIGSFLLIWTDF